MINQIASVWKSPYKRFIALGIIAFILWDAVIYGLLIKDSSIDMAVFHIVQSHSRLLLSVFFNNISLSDSVISFQGIPAIKVIRACNGLNFMGVFLCFVIAFPRPVISKLIFIVTGLPIIHFLNVIRIATLAIIVKTKPELFDLMHSWVFIIIIYAAVLGMSLLWIKLSELHDQ